jgi:hypothetical protein
MSLASMARGAALTRWRRFHRLERAST